MQIHRIGALFRTSPGGIMIFYEYSKRSVHVAKRALGAVFMAGALCASSLAWAELPAVKNYAGTEYLTGGFGIDESTAIKNAMPDYPLAFTFTAQGGNRSAYVSQVQVVVRNDHDATVLNVESQGPFLLVRLAPGSYQVHATYKNQTQSRSVTVTDDKSTRVMFAWAREDDQPLDQNVEAAADSRFEFAPGSIPGLD